MRKWNFSFTFNLIIKINKMATAFKKLHAKKHSDSSDDDSSSGKEQNPYQEESKSVEDVPQATGTLPESVSVCSHLILSRPLELLKTPSLTPRSGKIVREHLWYVPVA
jgi:hypothetical protein